MSNKSFPYVLGSNYWVFDAEHRIKGPDSLVSLGLHVSNIQAALRVKEHHSQHTYFFKSGNYWRLDPQENRVDTSAPRRIQQDWWGVPEEIDAAFQEASGMSRPANYRCNSSESKYKHERNEVV